MHSYWDDFWALKGYDGRRRDRHGARPTPRRRAGSRRSATNSAHDLAASLRHADRRCTASRTCPAPPSSATSIRRRRRSPSRPPASSHRLPADLRRRDVRALLARVRRPARRHARRGTTTRPTRCATSARSCASAGASARTRCSTSSWPAGARRTGTSGPRSSGATRASRASSATCRTAGSRRTSSAPRSTCSRTSATATARSCSAAGIPPAWLDGGGVAVKGLRTPYGPLSYSLDTRGLGGQLAGLDKIHPKR